MNNLSFASTLFNTPLSIFSNYDVNFPVSISLLGIDNGRTKLNGYFVLILTWVPLIGRLL